MSLYILATFYASMVAAGYIVEVLFGALGIIPSTRQAEVIAQGPTWNYTTVLNIIFLAAAAVLVWRFLKTGGPEMLRMMEMPPEQMEQMASDPVCGMAVDPRTATERAEYRGATYHFCSAGCRAAFEQDPERYAGERAAAGSGHDHGVHATGEGHGAEHTGH